LRTLQGILARRIEFAREDRVVQSQRVDQRNGSEWSVLHHFVHLNPYSLL
jgi:hypothetical protein